MKSIMRRMEFLIKATYLYLFHTIVHLISYLLQECDMAYVFLGKFQVDHLESRIGNYRQLSGSNYLVSVKDVLQSEKTLKVLVYGKYECFVIQILYVCVLCAVLNAAFCITFSLITLAEDARGDHME